jgi:hypothetical protein
MILQDHDAPSTEALERVRRSAARRRAKSACYVCKRSKARCDDARPCVRCVETNAACLEPFTGWRIPPAAWLLVPVAELLDEDDDATRPLPWTAAAVRVQ